MPIAHCILGPDIKLDISPVSLIVERWADYAGISGEHMTLTLTKSDVQIGVCYRVIATLYLPSLWSGENVGALQLALARSLADCFDCTLASVHVMAAIIQSGLVVEDGAIVEW